MQGTGRTFLKSGIILLSRFDHAGVSCHFHRFLIGWRYWTRFLMFYDVIFCVVDFHLLFFLPISTLR